MAEHYLKLIPGEIIGEVINRKIHHEPLLCLIEEVFEEELKAMNKVIEIEPNKPLTINIIPINDNEGTILRICIILQKTKPQKNKKEITPS